MNPNVRQENPDHIGGKFEPYHFADQTLAEEYEEFDTYIALRVEGTPSELALIEAFEMIRFGMDISNIRQLAVAIETNPYVRRRFKEVLAAKDAKGMWTINDSVNHLLRLVKDPSVRDSTRLNAIVQLNVMCGYVQLDELTARRVDKTISDFKRQHAAWVAAGSPGALGAASNPSGTKH